MLGLVHAPPPPPRGRAGGTVRPAGLPLPAAETQQKPGAPAANQREGAGLGGAPRGTPRGRSGGSPGVAIAVLRGRAPRSAAFCRKDAKTL